MISGKYASKIVKNTHSYTIAYLNRLIHGLMTVSKDFYDNSGLREEVSWPSPPNLLSFKVGDLMRWKY